MRRGEVWWANLPRHEGGSRPVLILTRNAAIPVRLLLTVAPVSRTQRQILTEVRLDPADGMPKTCAVNLDSLFTLHKSLLSNRICALIPAKMGAVEDALRFALALD